MLKLRYSQYYLKFIQISKQIHKLINIQIFIQYMFKPSLKRSKPQHHHPKPATATLIGPSGVGPSKSYTRPLKSYEHLIQKLEKPDVYIPSLFKKSADKQSANFRAYNSSSRLIMPLSCHNLPYPVQVRDKLNLSVQNVKSRLIGGKFGVYWLITEDQLHIWHYNNNCDNSNIQGQAQTQTSSINQLAVHRRYKFQKNIRTIQLGHFHNLQSPLVNLDNKGELFIIGFAHIIDLYSIDLQSLEIKPIDIRIKVQYNQVLQKIYICENGQIMYTGDQGYLTRVCFDSINGFGFPSVTKSNAKPSIFASRSYLPALFQSKVNTKIFTQKILTTQDKVYVLIRKQSEGSYWHRIIQSVVKYVSGKRKLDQGLYHVEKEIHVYRIRKDKSGKIDFCGVIQNSDIQRKIKQSYAANERLSQYMEGQVRLDPASSYNNNINNVNNNSTILTIFNTNTSTAAQNKQRSGETYANANTYKTSADRISIVTVHGLYLTLRENVVESGSNYYNINFQEVPKVLPEELFTYNPVNKISALFMKGSKQSNLNLSVDPNRNTEQRVQQEYLQKLQPLIERQFKIVQSFGQYNLNVIDNKLCVYFNEKQIQITRLQKNPGFLIQTCTQSPSLYDGADTDVDGQMDNNREWILFSKQEITVIRRTQIWEHLLSIMSVFLQQEREMANANRSGSGLDNMNNSMSTNMNSPNNSFNSSLNNSNMSINMNATLRNRQRQNYKLAELQYYSHSALYELGKIIGFDKICQNLCKLILKIEAKRLTLFPTNDSTNRSQIGNYPVSFNLNSEIIELTKQQYRNYVKLRNNNRIKNEYQFASNRKNNMNSNILFTRWLMPKRKNVRLETVILNQELQTKIWKYFALYSLDAKDQRISRTGIPGSHGQFFQTIQINNIPTSINSTNQVEQLSNFSKTIYQSFRYQYYSIKDLKLEQIRKSPSKVTKIKINLKALFNLLMFKAENELGFLQSFVYAGSSRIEKQREKQRGLTQGQNINNVLINNSNANMSMNSQYQNRPTAIQPNPKLNQTTITTIETQVIPTLINKTSPLTKMGPHQNQKSWIQREFGSEPYGMLGFKKQSETSTQQLCKQLIRLIPKIISIIELYELLAASAVSQYKYEFREPGATRAIAQIPTIEQFIQDNYRSKKYIKSILLDLFSSTDLSDNLIVNRFNLQLPSLRLEADIFLAKWIKFIYKYQTLSDRSQNKNEDYILKTVPQGLPVIPVQNEANTIVGKLMSNQNPNAIVKKKSYLHQQMQTRTPINPIVSADSSNKNIIVTNNNKKQSSVMKIFQNLLSFNKSSNQTKKRQSVTRIPSTVVQQIKVSDIQKLAQKLEYEQIIKIRFLFEEIPKIYLTLLLKNMENRKIQYKIVKELISKKQQETVTNRSGIANSTAATSYTSQVNRNLLFVNDKNKANGLWRQWLYQEILLDRNQIQGYLQYQAILLQTCRAEQYKNRQASFDDCNKMLLKQEQSSEGIQFLKDLVRFMRQQKILQEKVYRLTLAIDSITRTSTGTGTITNRPNNIISNLFEKQTRRQLMSSIDLVGHSLKRNREELFDELSRQQRQREKEREKERQRQIVNGNYSNGERQDKINKYYSIKDLRSMDNMMNGNDNFRKKEMYRGQGFI